MNKYLQFISGTTCLSLLSIGIFIWAANGLISGEALLKVRFKEPSFLVFSGAANFILCLANIIMSIVIMFEIIKISYKRFNSGEVPIEGDARKPTSKLELCLLVYWFFSCYFSYFYQTLTNPLYR